MVLRDDPNRMPSHAAPKRRKSGKQSQNKRTALIAGGAAVVVVAGVGVYVATSSGGSGVSGPAAGSPPPTVPAAPSSAGGGATPLGGASYAGALQSTFTGAQLASWNKTSYYCTQAVAGSSWELADGTVGTDANGNATLSTTGKSGSCVAAFSPGQYSSDVIEAEVYLPALPGKPNTIADWTSVWLTNESDWPTDGELDAVEAEPATGVNAVAWHWGSPQSPQEASTDGFGANAGDLTPGKDNLTPGWHTVDIVYTKGFFAVYYDGKEFTSSGQESVVTGDPLNLIFSSGVTPNNASVQKSIGTTPQNSDSSPATMAVKYVKVWAYK